jgi:hypothetical protein
MTPDAVVVRRVMAEMEMSLNMVVTAENLQGSWLEGWQGPTFLTFRFRLWQPTGAGLARALRLARACEMALTCAPVRIYQESGILHVEVPSPWPVTLAADLLAGRGLHVPLGVSGRSSVAGLEVVGYDFQTDPHLALLGATGSGKTTGLYAILYQLARQNPAGRVRFVICALAAKAAGWQTIASLSHCQALITSGPEMHQALRWFSDLARTRAGRQPAYFLVVDDLLAILDQVDISDQLRVIASLGREPGIHLLLASQQGGKAGVADTAANLRGRLVFAAADARQAALAAGRGGTGAERLGLTPGDALLILGERQRRLLVAAVPSAAWASLPHQTLEQRPWRPASSPAASTASTGAAPSVLPAPPAPVIPASTPVLARLSPRPPDEAALAELRRRYALFGTKNRTLISAYGSKNVRYLAWLNQALAE